MPRKYPYYPSFNGGGEKKVTAKLVALCAARWQTKSLGTYTVRLIKNDHTTNKKIGEAGYEKYLSVHATGFAADIQYRDETVARQMWDWFLGSSVIDGKEVEHSEHLALCEIHWYAYGDFGAGWRCSRGAGKSGVKIFTKDDNAGSYQGSPRWLHIEVSDMTAQEFEQRWRELPKPE